MALPPASGSRHCAQQEASENSMSGPLPQQFGKYQLIQKIATGGMAEIFKAMASGEGGFEKLVAIKRILPHLSSEPEFVSMFMREAKLAALLSHPNIVQIYDFGKENNTYYIAMEYLWGHDLGAVLKKVKGERSLPLECALYIASRICAGLEYSHHLKDLSGNPLNIIHRDVNPQNIIITHQGEVKIVDFGIAKIAEMDSTTKVGTLKGKVPYMSPEQAAGQVIDKRSDIFSTGVILYEMATGVKAFQGGTMEVLDLVRNAEIQPPELAAPDLPAEIYEILHTALAKNPEQRFQTCAEMHARLDNCLTMFSERQNAENLSRHIRQLLADEALETKAPEPPKTHLSVIQAPEPPGAEKTRTLLADTFPPAAGAVVPPVKKAGGAGQRQWIAGALLAAIIMGSILLYIAFTGSPKSDKLQVAPTSSESNEPKKGIPLDNPKSDQLSAALAAVQHKEHKKAIALFEEVLASRPELIQQAAAPYSMALLNEALELLGSDPEGGKGLLVKSIAVNPANARGHYELGKLQTKLKNYQEAIGYYQKVIEFDPTLPETYFNLGFLYTKLEDYVHGEEMFLKAIALSPPYVDEAYFNLAMVQKSQGRVQDSIKALEQAVNINPHNSKAIEYLDKLRRE
jgi:serine/threonine protein kinase